MKLKKAEDRLYNLQLIIKEDKDGFWKNKLPVLKKYISDKFRMSDLDAAIAKLEAETDVPDEDTPEGKFEYGFDVWTGGQKFLTDRPNFVVQLNLKPSYMNIIFSKMGNEFKEWYLKLAKTSHNSGHPVFPIPGHTIAWARVHELEEDTWLINEIQEDWGVIKATAVAISKGETEYYIDGDGNRHPIPQGMKELLTQPHQLEWLDYITGDILLDYHKITLRAVLDLARENGVKHIYMLPHLIQTHITSHKKRLVLYDDLPKKFHFNKVKVDLHEKYPMDRGYMAHDDIVSDGYELDKNGNPVLDKNGKPIPKTKTVRRTNNPDYYWYRTAKRKKAYGSSWCSEIADELTSLAETIDSLGSQVDYGSTESDEDIIGGAQAFAYLENKVRQLVKNVRGNQLGCSDASELSQRVHTELEKYGQEFSEILHENVSDFTEDLSETMGEIWREISKFKTMGHTASKAVELWHWDFEEAKKAFLTSRR